VCDQRLLACGHCCEARCYFDSVYLVFLYLLPCQQLYTPCKDSCQKATRSEDSGLCIVKKENMWLPCGHLKDSAACYLVQDVSKIVRRGS
jgi:hypothetical protein